MRRFILISGMLFTLTAVCAGCGGKVNYVLSSDEELLDESDEELEASLSDLDEEEYQSEAETEVPEDTTSDSLAVYVCGAVNTPGVYYFEAGDIKSLALEAAGGFAEGAAIDYINLADKLYDGEKLYFPYEKEVESGEIKYDSLSGAASSEEAQQDTLSGKVNINTADKTELMTLPGIGESKAELIIDYRESNGAFNSIEDIMNINGIKEGVYSKVKDYITVGN